MADALPHLFDTAPNLIYQLVRSCLSNFSASTGGRRTLSTVDSPVNKWGSREERAVFPARTWLHSRHQPHQHSLANDH
jgi:hypothetical protein